MTRENPLRARCQACCNDAKGSGHARARKQFRLPVFSGTCACSINDELASGERSGAALEFLVPGGGWPSSVFHSLDGSSRQIASGSSRPKSIRSLADLPCFFFFLFFGRGVLFFLECPGGGGGAPAPPPGGGRAPPPPPPPAPRPPPGGGVSLGEVVLAARAGPWRRKSDSNPRARQALLPSRENYNDRVLLDCIVPFCGSPRSVRRRCGS